VRNAFADTLYEAAKSDKRVTVVVADISPAGSMQKFREEFPERFINTGVSEQIMIGLCAGMALRGMRPFAYTIATFTFYRPFEFVRDDLCYQNLPVTVVGIGGGLAYSTLGGTHHAQEDVVLASALPNMTVLAPCDPAECREAARWCATQDRGPVYLRLGKAGEPDLTSRAVEPFVFGKLRYLRRGGDVCILSYGPITRLAAELAGVFEARGESVSVVSVHTQKPLDADAIVDALHRHRHVVVIEETAPYALGLRVKALAWETRARCRLDTFSLQDAFIHSYGTPAELLSAHGLDLRRLTANLGLA
jgi:transketolase